MYVIKKDNTHEPWNVQKVVVAVNKSAYRALVKFTQEELDFICDFVETKAKSLGKEGIPIAEMHNIVEGALEQVKPEVAKSYRDYRNYKQDFVKMLDEVYKKPVHHVYRRQGKQQHRQRSGFHKTLSGIQSAEQRTVPEILHDHRRTPGMP